VAQATAAAGRTPAAGERHGDNAAEPARTPSLLPLTFPFPDPHHPVSPSATATATVTVVGERAAPAMGRPPSTGAPAFRFLPSEVAEMEARLQQLNNAIPTRAVLQTLADKFSASPERAGRVAIQPKQVRPGCPAPGHSPLFFPPRPRPRFMR